MYVEMLKSRLKHYWVIESLLICFVLCLFESLSRHCPTWGFAHVRSCRCIPLTSTSVTSLSIGSSTFHSFFPTFLSSFLPFDRFALFYCSNVFFLIGFAPCSPYRSTSPTSFTLSACKMIATVKLLPTPEALMRVVLRWKRGERGTNCTLICSTAAVGLCSPGLSHVNLASIIGYSADKTVVKKISLTCIFVEHQWSCSWQFFSVNLVVSSKNYIYERKSALAFFVSMGQINILDCLELYNTNSIFILMNSCEIHCKSFSFCFSYLSWNTDRFFCVIKIYQLRSLKRE